VTVIEHATADTLGDNYFGTEQPDPRAMLAWLSANRWPEDGVRFLEVPRARAACAVRFQDDHTGWARMNATDITAGTGRDVEQTEQVLKDARTEGLRQLNVCALGYGQSVFPEAGNSFDADALVTALENFAATQGRLLTFLHMDPHDPVLPVLRGRGWSVGVTDQYFRITDVGADKNAYLARFSADRRRQIRREMQSLERVGATASIYQGDVPEVVQEEVARLEACSDEKHGIVGDPARLLRVNERLKHAFGPRYSVTLVRDRNGQSVASSTAVLGSSSVLLRMVGLGPGSENNGAYFHVAYYLLMELARRNGADSVLLSTGSATPKLRRGATAQPLLSAVPPAAPAHSALLRRTHETFATV
jgi:hypothetical protein